MGLVGRGVLIRALWDALLELLHLVAQEIELHALVDIESGSTSVVVPKVTLHEINLHREKKSNGERAIAGSETINLGKGTYRIRWIRHEHLRQHWL